MFESQSKQMSDLLEIRSVTRKELDRVRADRRHVKQKPDTEQRQTSQGKIVFE